MLTIFTTPKAFKGHFAIIQENAIASWCQLRPRCQLILLGNEEGVAKIAQKYHALHVPNVATSKFGTPLLPDIFNKAYKMAKFKKLAYVNCDIILTSDFIEVIRQIKLPTFFLTGSRWDFNIKTRLSFSDNWSERFLIKVSKKGNQKNRGPTDYFVFTPKINFKMPKLIIGRTYWDAWLIFRAKQLGLPVIDATQTIWAVHQRHNYSHAGGFAKVWLGPEAQQNKKLIGDRRKYFNCRDADYILTKEGLKKQRISFARIIRKIETAPVLIPKISAVVYPLNFLIRVVRFARDKTKLFLKQLNIMIKFQA